MGDSTIKLAAGDFVVELAPRIGGSVTSFRWHRGHGVVDLMRPLSKDALARRDPTGVALFPMVPYANRIVGNRFAFEGLTHQFEPNVPGEPLTLHGTGWQSAWTVASANAARAELALDHIEPQEPYSYSASQRWVLEPDRLLVTIRIANRGERAMPFGFGLHPWWTREPGITLRFRSTHFWLEGPGYIATDRVTLPPELDFSQPKLLPRTWRNNCYSGWDGRAEIEFPRSGVGLGIEADPAFRHLVLYCDPQKSVFCLEPQTHAIGALNRVDRNGEEDLGLIILRPGESVAGTVAFIPFALRSTALNRQNTAVE